jgi:stalled ribosome alternative rescue factor ArfA
MIEVTSPDKKVAALALAVIRARVNKDGLMGSASREHKVKKGKGSFRRRAKHQKRIW